MSPEEAIVSNMWRIAAIVELLGCKGLGAKQGRYSIIAEFRSKNLRAKIPETAFPELTHLSRSILSLAIAALQCISPSPILADTFVAKVVAVVDGDTIEVLKGQRQERIELYGIDCPEKGQPFGPQAKQATAKLTLGQQVSIVKRAKDKDHHIVADVLLPDGKNLNQKLVLNGWCWWYRKHAPKDMALQQAEEVAKVMKKGLWADQNPVPPWLYRRHRLGAYP